MEKLLGKAVNAKRSSELTDQTNKIKLAQVFKSESISNGLRQALATGNWGKDKDNNV
jgi:DNA-directed RNA polymerase II subunit RPB2